MKKLSISLFAVLAVVFALNSAFTTKATKATDGQGWFLVKTENVYSTPLTDFDFADVNAPYANRGAAQTASPSSACIDDEGLVCGALIDYEGSSTEPTAAEMHSGEVGDIIFRDPS